MGNGTFGQISAFLAHLIPCLPKKTMQTRCGGSFSVMSVKKLLLPPDKIRIFGPKTAQNMHLLLFWAKYCHYWPIWSHARPKNNANKVSVVFPLHGYQKVCFLPLKLGFLAQKYAFIGPYRPCWFIWCTGGRLVDGCGAGCISQDTYVLYNIHTRLLEM